MCLLGFGFANLASYLFKRCAACITSWYRALRLKNYLKSLTPTEKVVLQQFVNVARPVDCHQQSHQQSKNHICYSDLTSSVSAAPIAPHVCALSITFVHDLIAICIRHFCIGYPTAFVIRMNPSSVQH